ncbi:MAG: hypothetical protein FGM24_09140 [Candidatus Kapabacteria bacterium]|nr:hypothetical protein [Candidatus Kapabacteria bacterium]
MQQRINPDQQAQHLFQEEGAQQHHAQPELEAAVLRFWETVRKSADTIVTLRQENARLQARLAQASDTTELRAEIAALKADVMTLRATNEQYQTDIMGLRAELAAERQKEAVVVESPVNAELLAEVERLRAANAAAALELESMQTRMTDELAQAVTIESPVNPELEAEIEQLRADVASLERTITTHLQQIRERDHIIVDLQATVADMQGELEAKAAQHAEPVDADHERELIALEALQERLRELEPLAMRHREQESLIVDMQTELDDVKQELERTMAIVLRYREAGLRHIEDPDMAAQMTLFMPAAVSAPTPAGSTLQQVLSKDEVLALAQRLDNVAYRIDGLLGIS